MIKSPKYEATLRIVVGKHKGKGDIQIWTLVLEPFRDRPAQTVARYAASSFSIHILDYFSVSHLCLLFIKACTEVSATLSPKRLLKKMIHRSLKLKRFPYLFSKINRWSVGRRQKLWIVVASLRGLHLSAFRKTCQQTDS